MAKSKNNPNVRKKQEVVIRKCEFCGSEKGVHPAKLKTRIAWVCNEDNCIRHK